MWAPSPTAKTIKTTKIVNCGSYCRPEKNAKSKRCLKMNTTIGAQKAPIYKQQTEKTGSEKYATEKQPEKQGNLPEKKFRAGAISATVWLNKGHNQQGGETEYRTISLERAYADKEGKWQTTNSYRIGDLPKAAVVLQHAYEFLVLQEQDLFKASN